jgi:hypothetical protein
MTLNRAVGKTCSKRQNVVAISNRSTPLFMAVYGAQRKWCSGDAGPLLKENWTLGGPPPFAARDPNQTSMDVVECVIHDGKPSRLTHQASG